MIPIFLKPLTTWHNTVHGYWKLASEQKAQTILPSLVIVMFVRKTWSCCYSVCKDTHKFHIFPHTQYLVLIEVCVHIRTCMHV